MGGIPRVAWVFAGSVVIAVGSAIAGIYAFQDHVLLVFLGFLLFFAGYRLSQTGVHDDDQSSLRENIGAVTTSRGIARVGLLGVGGYGIAFGVTTFTQTILDPALSSAVISGVSSIGGYMFAHVGMNGNLL